MTNTITLGPWPTGMNMRAQDASLGVAARLLVNVDIDPQGRAQARRKSALSLPLPGAHSLTAFNGRVYGIQNGTVFNWSPTTGNVQYLQHGVGKARMSWDVHAGDLYGVSSKALFRVSAEHKQLSWGSFAETSDADGVRYTAPPPAENFVAFGAHLLFASGRRLWWTPAFQPQAVAPFRDFVYLPEDIVLLAPVDTGVWVASADTTWFLRGRVPGSWALQHAANYGALGSSHVHTSDSAYWATERGIAAGSEQGVLTTPQEECVALTCAEAPALFLAPWHSLQVVATFPVPKPTERAFSGFLDSATLKGV